MRIAGIAITTPALTSAADEAKPRSASQPVAAPRSTALPPRLEPIRIPAGRTQAAPGETVRRSPAAMQAALDAASTPAPSAPTPVQEPAKVLAAAMAKGDALEVAALVEEAPSATARRELLNARNEAGDTPVLAAVRAKAPHVAAMLAYLGADLTRSSSQGLTAPFVALAASDTRSAKALLSNAKFREALHDPLWRSPLQVEQAINAMTAAGRTSDADADALASKLTGVAARHFSDAAVLQKYFSHLESFATNPLGVEATGWSQGAFLAVRVRSLVALALDPTPLGAAHAGARGKLAAEIASALEALRFSNRADALRSCREPALHADLCRLEAESIARRVASMPAGFEYSLSAGWSGSPGHAIYASFASRVLNGQEVVTLRVDNRGAGSDRHERDGNGVYPYVVNVPKAALAQPQTRAALEQVLVELIALRATPPSPQTPAARPDTRFYDALDVFKAQLIGDHGPIVMRDGAKAFPKLDRQTTGNCVVANHEPGLTVRLGPELAGAVIEFEKASAARRLFEILQPSVLQAHVVKNRQRVAEALGAKGQAQARNQEVVRIGTELSAALAQPLSSQR